MKAERPRVQGHVKRSVAAGRNGRGLRFLLMLAALCVLVMIVRGRIYVVREIKVTGNLTRSASEIAGQSGLYLGMNIFRVDKDSVERNLSANNYVELLEVHIETPDTVILEVRERTACAAINCAGVILVVDEEGYILERLTGVPEIDGVIVISGMDVSIGAQGRTIESGVAGQKDAMKKVIGAVRGAGMEKQFSELNVADMDNLYMMSDGGIQVMLGDETMLEDKLVWTRAVLDKLMQEGVMSGVLDVSSGKNAVYADR